MPNDNVQTEIVPAVPTHRPVALITGTSRGIGRSMALHLAERGVSILGTYRSREDEARAVVRLIEERGARAAMLQLDTSETGTFGAFAGQVATTLEETFERSNFDFLVNNAGLGIYASFAETTEDQFDQLVAVHFKGPFFLTQQLLPLIVDGGSILNVSTGLTRFASPRYSAYAAAKGAIEILTRYLAQELAPRRIRVNVIAPGAVETDFGGGALRDNPTLNAQVAAHIALGRVGLPDDIGAAAAAILAGGFGWINGERIEVSGGQRL